uniref:Uncharacterized protein n=1 Tax=viral metagenome TaxID=1070528 RepID=A0A6C0F4P5_9ZZZZ
MNYSKRRDFEPILNMNHLANNTESRQAYYISHNGLGDLIISTSALRFFTKYYNRVFLICKNIHYAQLQLILQDEPRITIVSVVMDSPFGEFDNSITVLRDAYVNSDVFCCGHLRKVNPTKITNKSILSYNPNNLSYNTEFDTVDASFINKFYTDAHLDLRIYYEYFSIPSTPQSRELYDLVKDYKRVIFTQTKCSSNIKLNIDGVKLKYMNDDDAIILCNDENLYDKTTNPTKYEKSQRFVKNNIAWYIDTILNCNEIYTIDSCFIAIVLPLVKTNRLKADVVRIIKRELVNEILL